MPHSYTNDVRGDGSVVVKRYQGPDWAARRLRERTILDRLRDRLPVPPLLGADDDTLLMRYVAGVHGQELVEAGLAAPVLRACGQTLRRIHEIDPAQVFKVSVRHPGQVLVHGDYGPNNVLLDPDTLAVTAVLDWEWARPGNPIQDLAWCEWIIRMHHHEHRDALEDFFDGYGHRPLWTQRHAAMLARCQALLEMCRRWTPEAAELWRHRITVTAAWTELTAGLS